MRYFFDTEFMEDGKTIELLSIGIVSQDGREFYAENSEADHSRANPWVRENVLPFLIGKGDVMLTRRQIAMRVRDFVPLSVYADRAQYKPEFWAYYGSYDWVVLCQLFGTMMDLPKGWPMYVNDVKQFCNSLGDPELPKQTGREHYALDDARWTREAYCFLKARPG
jgi:hypothetical protein